MATVAMVMEEGKEHGSGFALEERGGGFALEERGGAFGAVGRILLRRRCQAVAAAAGSLDHKMHVIAIPAWCSLHIALGLRVWHMNKNGEHAEKSTRPSEIDWVGAGAVSPVVRKQDGCASVEAAHYLQTLQSISLAVQELIDCNTENNGCNGGYYQHAFKYIRDNGLSSESSYPYMAKRSASGCKRDKTVAAATRILGFWCIDSTEDALEEAVAKRPVVVRLQGTPDLFNYKGGIIECEALPAASATTWHAVLIVGYGTDPDGVKYWRFKNSWGKDWGEGGFGRIRRHVADKRGVLGIFMYGGLYPVLD
ncbi:ervatamin-B-like [Triticum aestivum]|uniref:ervatamin-B-like n=1 Tax=Triticum aestivum TaxID=4565 RepID=UPI001D0234A0|nr:ervatamin-B-like [Triticum aestivum]